MIRLNLCNLYTNGDWNAWTRENNPTTTKVLDIIVNQMGPLDVSSLDGMELINSELNHSMTISRYKDRFLCVWRPGERAGIPRSLIDANEKTDAFVPINLGCGDNGMVALKFFLDRATMEKIVTQFLCHSVDTADWPEFQYRQNIYDDYENFERSSTGTNNDDIPF